MSNAILLGEWEEERTIADMEPGEVGFTVPWAYDRITGNVRDYFTIRRTPFGTSILRVECILPGNYVVLLEDLDRR